MLLILMFCIPRHNFVSILNLTICTCISKVFFLLCLPFLFTSAFTALGKLSNQILLNLGAGFCASKMQSSFKAKKYCAKDYHLDSNFKWQAKTSRKTCSVKIPLLKTFEK